MAHDDDKQELIITPRMIEEGESILLEKKDITPCFLLAEEVYKAMWLCGQKEKQI